ncbi:MAG: helix-turn-helix domain-containing protein [Pseudonocardiaceae bacterium]
MCPAQLGAKEVAELANAKGVDTSSAAAANADTAGHTQQTLAAALKVHRRSVLRWEDGSVDPHPGQRKRLAAALGISTGELADVLRAGPVASGDDHGSPAEGGESAAVVSPVAGAEDVAGSHGARWTRRHTRLTSLAVAGGLVAAAGLSGFTPGWRSRRRSSRCTAGGVCR